MIGRLAAQMLDPYFVREEELASLIDRKSIKNVARRNNVIGILPTGNLQIAVPNQHEWFVYSIIAYEPTDAGAGSLPKRHWIDLIDDQGNVFMSIGIGNLPAVTANSWLTWGIDLSDSNYNNGQLPPSYFITQTLPVMILKENYIIRINRDGVGGVPVVNATFRILYEERF